MGQMAVIGHSHGGDFVVTPNLDDTGSSSLHGGGEIRNVAVQDLCPPDLNEHLAVGTVDNVKAKRAALAKKKRPCKKRKKNR